MGLAMKLVAVTCRQGVPQPRHLQDDKMQIATARPASCNDLWAASPWPAWTAGMCQPLNQLKTQMLWMPMAVGGMQSNPSISPRWFNQLPAKCCLCVPWYYTNIVITAVQHFAIKYNLPGLENTILLSVVGSPPWQAPTGVRFLFEISTAVLKQNSFCSGVLSHFVFVYEIRKCWEQLSG